MRVIPVFVALTCLILACTSISGFNFAKQEPVIPKLESRFFKSIYIGLTNKQVTTLLGTPTKISTCSVPLIKTSLTDDNKKLPGIGWSYHSDINFLDKNNNTTKAIHNYFSLCFVKDRVVFETKEFIYSDLAGATKLTIDIANYKLIKKLSEVDDPVDLDKFKGRRLEI